MKACGSGCFWPTLMMAGVLGSGVAGAQLSRGDYERAASINERYSALTVDVAENVQWLPGGGDLFVYNKTVPGGHMFTLVDAASAQKSAAFDHARLAAALSAADGKQHTPVTLPFKEFHFDEKRTSIDFYADGHWRCDLAAYTCARVTTGSASEMDEDDQDAVARNSADDVRASPDGRWLAYVVNYNVVVRAKDATSSTVLSTDGSEGDFYDIGSLVWSPDSTHLVAYRVRPGYRRQIHYVESSPATQLQPLYPVMNYTKPGDVLAVSQPVLFDVAARREIPVSQELFPNPFDISGAVWRKDSRAFTFEYNQRGHQLYRVVEVEAKTGTARSVLEETSPTFVDYRALVMNQYDTGKEFRYDVADGREVVWASERDGYEHLYLLDGATGAVKNKITQGEYVVRSVDHVDEASRQIWFQASGMQTGEDPYFSHAYRIGFDGQELTPLTPAAGNHKLTYSEDGKYAVDLHSTIADASVLDLYATEGNRKTAELERGNISALAAAGWKAPEVFTAKGRDGRTDIWGIIWRPAHFDPQKKYPVIEDIYAGPQGSFVPKAFTTRVEPLTELGFVVVQIDGMGTNNRSRAFHDVAWKNLKDAGFEDRILWHKAVAAKYPWYDITRVGIFGTSAGGQSAMGALLFHPEFYKAAVANSGCHDNRMDKIWWNEQWMGWPIGPEYSASSNVDNAYRLQGKLMLVVGEMDKNVDPSSTFQVADRLEKANKTFDLLYVPGGGHGAGGAYGQRKLEDFFVHALLSEEPPEWNAAGGSH